MIVLLMLAAMVIMMMLCNWYDGNENVVGGGDDDDADTVSGGGLMAYFCRWHFKKAIKEFKNVGIVFLVVFFWVCILKIHPTKKGLPSPVDFPVHLTSQSI